MDNLANDMMRMAKDLVGGFSYDMNRQWDDFVAWIKKRYRKASIVIDDRKTGNAIWVKSLKIDGRRIAELQSRGWQDSMGGIDTEFTVWGGDSYDSLRTKNNETIPLAKMKKFWVDEISPEREAKMKGGGNNLTVKQAERLQAASEGAMKVFKDIVKGVHLSSYTYGKVDYRANGMFGWRDDKNDTDMLEISFDIPGRYYWVKVFGTMHRASDPSGLIKILRKIKGLTMGEIRKMGAFEAADILGKPMKDPVRSFGRPKVSFDVVDEWVITNIEIPVSLRTSKPIPRRVMKKWLEKNFRDVMGKAPEKTPGPPEGRGMEYDEPSGSAYFISPSEMSYNSVEDIGFSQSGNKGTIHFTESRR